MPSERSKQKKEYAKQRKEHVKQRRGAAAARRTDPQQSPQTAKPTSITDPTATLFTANKELVEPNDSSPEANTGPTHSGEPTSPATNPGSQEEDWVLIGEEDCPSQAPKH